MKESDYTQIEKELGLRLPDVYKKLMTNHPEDFKELGEPYNGASWLYLKSEVKNIIETNQLFRDSFEGENFVKYMFVIGENGCGDFYFISTHETGGRVYTINHETGNLEFYSKNKKDYNWENTKMITADNLEDYENNVRNMLQSFEKEMFRCEEE